MEHKHHSWLVHCGSMLIPCSGAPFIVHLIPILGFWYSGKGSLTSPCPLCAVCFLESLGGFSVAQQPVDGLRVLD